MHIEDDLKSASHKTGYSMESRNISSNDAPIDPPNENRSYRDLIDSLFLSDDINEISHCFAIRPESLDEQTASRLAILLIKSGQIGLLSQFLLSRPTLEFRLGSEALLALIDAVERITERERELTIWPRTELPDAAQTTIYHAQSLIISRQRALINNLMSRF